MDFFRRRPLLSPIPNELDRDDEGELNWDSSPDLLFICSVLLSRKLLNSVGASSGCRRAGTQNNRDESSSLADDEGILGRAAAFRDGREGRSGSPAAPTSIDMRRKACRLLSS
jgi:hypothetical protein